MSLTERKHSGNLQRQERIILEWMLDKWIIRIWSNGRFCEHCDKPSCLYLAFISQHLYVLYQKQLRINQNIQTNNCLISTEWIYIYLLMNEDDGLLGCYTV